MIYNNKFTKLDAIEKFANKLEIELKKMYDLSVSSEDKYWSLKREIKIKEMLNNSEKQYQLILHNND